MSKKLINNPVDCVDEGIEGFVMTHPGLRVLGTQRVVIRDKVKYLLEIEEREREREREWYWYNLEASSECFVTLNITSW